jgi:hypothetical protein
LYVIGRAYFESYLYAYGVDADLFPLTTQDYLYYSLIAVASYIAVGLTAILGERWLLGAGIAAGLSLYVILLWCLDDMREKYRDKALLLGLFKKRWARRLVAALSGPFILSVTIVTAVAVAGILLIPLQLGRSAAAYRAEQEIQRDQFACTGDAVLKPLKACVQVKKDDKVLTTGRIIAVSTVNIAIAVGGRGLVFRQEGIQLKVL